MKDNKQRLFEMMGKVDSSFKTRLNENLMVEANPRIKRLSPTAPVMEKIMMWELVSTKARELYYSRKHSEAWIYQIHDKYAPYWQELYDAIEDTPEFTEYRKGNNITTGLHFGDMLA